MPAALFVTLETHSVFCLVVHRVERHRGTQDSSKQGSSLCDGRSETGARAACGRHHPVHCTLQGTTTTTTRRHSASLLCTLWHHPLLLNSSALTLLTSTAMKAMENRCGGTFAKTRYSVQLLGTQQLVCCTQCALQLLCAHYTPIN